jgi:hypothetical protein
MTAPPFSDPAIAAKFAEVPRPAQTGLLALRALIYAVARQTPGVGAVQETLKWGQPAYLTPLTKSGSTLRLAPTKTGFAIYAHCQTTIIADFQSIFPLDFNYEGNRAVHFEASATPPADKLALLITAALTYHLPRKAKAAGG